MIDSNKKITRKFFLRNQRSFVSAIGLASRMRKENHIAGPEWEYSKASFTNASVHHHVLEIVALWACATTGESEQGVWRDPDEGWIRYSRKARNLGQANRL